MDQINNQQQLDPQLAAFNQQQTMSGNPLEQKRREALAKLLADGNKQSAGSGTKGGILASAMSGFLNGMMARGNGTSTDPLASQYYTGNRGMGD